MLKSKLVRIVALAVSILGFVALVLWLRSRGRADDAVQTLPLELTGRNGPNTRTLPASQGMSLEVARVAQELRGPMRRITRLPIPADRAWGRRVIRTLLAILPTSTMEGVTIEKRKTPEVSVRIYQPAVRRSPAALFWIHGGGLIIGRAVQDDRLCALTARELGILVVSVEYRKAPEYPYPAALQRCSQRLSHH